MRLPKRFRNFLSDPVEDRFAKQDIAFDYDVLNRLEEVDNQAYAPPETHGYTYDDVGNLETVSYANGVTHTYTYNTLNRLTNLAVTDSIGQVLQSHTYTLNDVGHRTKVEEANGRVVDYEYDNLYRLTREVLGGTLPNLQDAIEYTYDDVGNRLTRTSLAATLINQNFGYDLNDRLNTDTYDDNRNTLTSTNGGEGVTDTYNFMDKLIRRVTTSGRVIDIIYDANGTRIRKSVTLSGSVTATTNYLVDENNHTGYVQVVEEQDGSYNVLKSYNYGHDLISVDQFVGASWELSYYLYDGHGNVRGLTDALGAITDTYIYDAFGNLIDSTGSTANAYLYTGEQYDFDLGMYFLRARYYNPEYGRFHTMDSFEGFSQDPKSLHKYLYSHANPVMRIDPSGNAPNFVSIGVTVGIVGMLATIVNHSANVIAADAYDAALLKDALDKRLECFDLVFETGILSHENRMGHLRWLASNGTLGLYDLIQDGLNKLTKVARVGIGEVVLVGGSVLWALKVFDKAAKAIAIWSYEAATSPVGRFVGKSIVLPISAGVFAYGPVATMAGLTSCNTAFLARAIRKRR